jgi:hypothetical protein
MFLVCFVTLAAPALALAQIRVHPTGVNVNAQGATTVLLTFGGLGEYRPVEALWCRRVVPAAPDIGQRCDPSTILGSLPIRYDQSRLAAQSFTDIMSIPPSVTRRAYQAAEAGDNSGFFYVRRFSRPGGGPDQYVTVTCRMSGGGARVPFSLVDVQLAFDVDTPVLFVATGDQPPPLSARIVYNGTGRLKGRWEVALPGEEIPSTRDLLTEASLPPEERGLQRRYTEAGRFNVFLSPGARQFTLPGPDPRRLPTHSDGTHYVLLRVEVSDDKEGDSNLAAAGAGTGIVHGGAVAGFPMPPLRYVVGGARTQVRADQASGGLTLVGPLENATAPLEQPIDFVWNPLPQAALYRIEIETSGGAAVLSALVERGRDYRAPDWLRARVPDGRVRWRVTAIDAVGNEIRVSEWRVLTLAVERP